MKFLIKHDIKGRLRLHLCKSVLSNHEADLLFSYLNREKCITYIKIYERTADVLINYSGDKNTVLGLLSSFSLNEAEKSIEVPEISGRELNSHYQDKISGKILLRYAGKLLVPYPLRAVYTALRAFKYMYKGVKCLLRRKIEVAVLDAVAIGISIVRNDIETAGSVMFLLSIGELLEEWTHKKSVDDLARSMALKVEKVWLHSNGQDILVPYTDIKEGDEVVVHMGNVIPFDAVVIYGEGNVNEASLTGESASVRKAAESYVYAGTIVEEGELIIKVKVAGSATRYDKIVSMIEDSQKLKSSLEGKAEHLADKLVPYTLAGTALTYLITRNATKALSVLMVDFSCALKLAMPIAVLSAIREAGLYDITVKGGKYLEAAAEAVTVVFDKTGTLTKAEPCVTKVVSFNGNDEDELLRIAACLEEHFPHSMAKAVVHAAKKKKLEHEEMHSKVNYIVAHGISSSIGDRKVIIGSYHFVFEDEKCSVPNGLEEKFEHLPKECSHLYMAVNNELAAVICIEDPLRAEAGEVIDSLRKNGIQKVVMMTGDSERTAKVIAEIVGVDEYYSEVLPEDKAKFIEKEKAKGRKVIMIGDGINDSPALSAADVGIAVSDGAEIAREIADITITADNLYEIVTLKRISNKLMKRISRNYRFIVGFNTALIALGVCGIIMPTSSAMLHNTSTLAIGVGSMKPLL